ncbi:hypothetical protein X275_08545 [Marinitoga sp. 1197]|uniref:HD-GYP domain-containing protein n=1 Tax=Marinitoga sp. 1197 TaxID=1428449 RepID=UPI0006591D4A|nr:HD-GYP domain-containing protein [Marinitoga sp. 1197]KLO21646.1 hypothetical protein X275_08545 [Marinitoga sp. 1197]
MKKEKLSLYQLISKSIMTIVITSIVLVLILISIFSYINLLKVEKSLRNNTESLIRFAFNSLYNTLYDFDSVFYEKLDTLMNEIKTSQNINESIEKFVSTSYKSNRENNVIKKVNIESIDIKLKNKLINLQKYNYLIELDLKSDKLLRNIYIKTDENFYVLSSILSIDRIKNTINNLANLKNEYDFISDINICTHEFEGLSQNFSNLTDEDKKYLEKVFSTEKDIVIKNNEKVKFYYVWKYEDEKTLFMPIGIILKLDFNKYRSSIIISITLFFILLSIVIIAIVKKAHKVSKQISKPFEIMLDNMKNFQKIRYLEFDKIMEKCEIKEINELMTEYQKMAEDIMTSFEEINAMNEELESSYKEIEKINNELEDAYLNFSTQLSIIAEGYDETTGNHVNRVGELSAFIAEKLGLNNDYVEKIRYYAPLHDIGKIMIPKEILLKKGPLTEEEWKVMEKHTIYGGVLIGDSPKFKIAKNIALYHHEKYNGEGYPYGLKGDKIPICAAIVSVVDVYDALRSERPYKRAFSHEEAINIILNGDNRTNPLHFNPEVLNILKKYEKDVKELWNIIDKKSSKLLELLKNIEKI